LNAGKYQLALIADHQRFVVGDQFAAQLTTNRPMNSHSDHQPRRLA
jgi:hypothetical protein